MVRLFVFLQDMYDNLSQKIEDVTRNSASFQFEGEFAVFSNTEKRNHPSIIKVINIAVKRLNASIGYMFSLFYTKQILAGGKFNFIYTHILNSSKYFWFLHSKMFEYSCHLNWFIPNRYETNRLMLEF